MLVDGPRSDVEKPSPLEALPGAATVVREDPGMVVPERWRVVRALKLPGVGFVEGVVLTDWRPIEDEDELEESKVEPRGFWWWDMTNKGGLAWGLGFDAVMLELFVEVWACAPARR